LRVEITGAGWVLVVLRAWSVRHLSVRRRRARAVACRQQKSEQYRRGRAPRGAVENRTPHRVPRPSIHVSNCVLIANPHIGVPAGP
jgi:hypothetical protein